MVLTDGAVGWLDGKLVGGMLWDTHPRGGIIRKKYLVGTVIKAILLLEWQRDDRNAMLITKLERSRLSGFVSNLGPTVKAFVRKIGYAPGR